jgi:hypothetical protein
LSALTARKRSCTRRAAAPPTRYRCALSRPRPLWVLPRHRPRRPPGAVGRSGAARSAPTFMRATPLCVAFERG